jgi:hypothetical protein
MSIKSIISAYKCVLAEQQVHTANIQYIDDPIWDVTLDHYGTNADKKLYRKTYKIRASSHDQAVKYITSLVGGRYIGASYDNISGEPAGDGGAAAASGGGD